VCEHQYDPESKEPNSPKGAGAYLFVCTMYSYGVTSFAEE